MNQCETRYWHIHRAIIEVPTGIGSNRLETSSLKNICLQMMALLISNMLALMEASSMLVGKDRSIDRVILQHCFEGLATDRRLNVHYYLPNYKISKEYP